MSPRNLPKIGGSFAPPITTDKIANYRELANTAEGQVKDEMIKLCDMVETYYQLGESGLPGTPHPVGNVKNKNGVVRSAPLITPLVQQQIDILDPLVPWGFDKPGEHINECEMLGRLFEGIDPQSKKDLRNAAFHLLWYAQELTNDRQPITTDRL